jgi:hypothetical protein
LPHSHVSKAWTVCCLLWKMNVSKSHISYKYTKTNQISHRLRIQPYSEMLTHKLLTNNEVSKLIQIRIRHKSNK